MGLVRASRAGPALRYQRFANEQILRALLGALRLALGGGGVKGQRKLVCRVSLYFLLLFFLQ